MRVLVCGGRDFQDAQLVFSTLDDFHKTALFSVLIQGGARGADSLAKKWAIERGVPVVEIKADWNQHGTAAGPIRNQEMMKLKPDLVIAFPGGRGTQDMVNRAQKANKRIACVIAPPKSKYNRNPLK